MTRTDLTRHPPVDRLRLVLEVLRAYVRARWVMRNGDAEVAVKRLRRWAHRHPIESQPDQELVAGWRLANAVTKTISPLPADSRCLFRSLTLLTLMERRGLSPTLVVAVRPKPFAAHAWIELHARPLLAEADPGYERLIEL